MNHEHAQLHPTLINDALIYDSALASSSSPPPKRKFLHSLAENTVGSIDSETRKLSRPFSQIRVEIPQISKPISQVEVVKRSKRRQIFRQARFIRVG